MYEIIPITVTVKVKLALCNEDIRESGSIASCFLKLGRRR
jgi:hypothetical protein